MKAKNEDKFNDRKYQTELKEKIARLKKQRKAIIVVHNYQREEIQDIADVIGDSFQLSKGVIKADAEVIVFCGVHFMAETASILNPRRTVLLPVKEAGCPMADMVTCEKLRALKAEHPDAAVVSYVNTSARLKAESDICCTSSNAIEVVRSLKEHRKVIFVPDRNLGRYVQANVPEKEIILWPGFCPTHIRLSEEEVKTMKAAHPGAEFIAHPECQPDVLALADHICSTGGMFKSVKSSAAREFIIGTEGGMIYRLQKENPEKKFYLASDHLVCPSMKLITLGWVAHSLETMTHEIKVEGEVREKALQALNRMLEHTGDNPLSAIAGY